MECAICGQEVNEHFQYELCSLCERVLCLKESCNQGRQCRDVDSCEKAQAFNRLRQVAKIKGFGLRCPACGGATATGEGYRVCLLCGLTVDISERRPP